MVNGGDDLPSSDAFACFRRCWADVPKWDAPHIRESSGAASMRSRQGSAGADTQGRADRETLAMGRARSRDAVRKISGASRNHARAISIHTFCVAHTDSSSGH